MVQASGSVATGTLSALCFALALAASAGVAYYCVKRRRREEQFGYFQVSAACGLGRGSGAAQRPLWGEGRREGRGMESGRARISCGVP